MKNLKLLFLPIIVLLITSCSSVRVVTDYDTQTDFNQYKTFAFYKKGIDKAPISDLDKKRIMRAIEAELAAKGMTKSATPDVLVSLFT
jgi:transcriptional regulator NrdR family protein